MLRASVVGTFETPKPKFRVSAFVIFRAAPAPNSFFEEICGVSEPTKRLKVYGARGEMGVTD
jgi:hypothetical protein